MRPGIPATLGSGVVACLQVQGWMFVAGSQWFLGGYSSNRPTRHKFGIERAAVQEQLSKRYFSKIIRDNLFWGKIQTFCFGLAIAYIP